MGTGVASPSYRGHHPTSRHRQTGVGPFSCHSDESPDEATKRGKGLFWLIMEGKYGREERLTKWQPGRGKKEGGRGKEEEQTHRGFTKL